MSAHCLANFVLSMKRDITPPPPLHVDPLLVSAVNAAVSKPKHVEMLMKICVDSLPKGFLSASLVDIADSCFVKLGSCGRVMQILRESDIVYRFKTDVKSTRTCHRNVYLVNWQMLNYAPSKLTGASQLAKVAFKFEEDRAKALGILKTQNAFIAKHASERSTRID